MIAMKKYLIKGALALFAGAFLFSCAEKESEYVPIVQQKVQTFEEVFKEVYGDIDPYQNWGFTNDLSLADPSTTEVIYLDSVAPASAGTRAFTRTANPEANLWGRTYTNVPDPLTAAQKKRVRLFFQYNQYPEDMPVSLKNFFVQDVYKGGTVPLWKDEDGYREYSKEVYNFGTSSTATGSSHMDYLTAGPQNDHIYNYNNAKCSTNDKVWDGRTYEEGYPLTAETAAEAGIGDWEAENFNHVVYHSDEIMLMENSSTACFGWHESKSEDFTTTQYRIISGEFIDNWATAFKAQHPDLDLGASVTGRNFVGLDYETKVDINSRLVHDIRWEDGVAVDYGLDYFADGIPYISNELDKYGHQVVPAYTEGAYPVKDRYVDSDQTKGNLWVIPTGVADGYFSDWIVCIVGAQKKNVTSRIKEEKDGEEQKTPVPAQCGRIFCEDLGVSSREDLDFNDVVFDVDIYQHYEAGVKKYYKIYSDGRKEFVRQENYSTMDHPTYSAEITLLAAGGTKPLSVAGKEVHDKFGVGITTMVNTYDENSTAFGSFENRKSVYLGSFTPSQLFPPSEGKPGKADTDPIYAIEIPIVVQWGNDVATLGSSLGGAPAKIFVPNHTTKWTVERKPLTLAYPKFADYVGNKNIQWWDDNLLTNDEKVRANYYRYNNATYEGRITPPIVITRIAYPSVSQDIMWPLAGTSSVMKYTNWKVEYLPLDFETYYPGDHITFYVKDLTDDSYMTVVFADGNKPYFIDTVIRNFDVDKDGNKTKKTSGVIEVELDEANAKKLNSSKWNGSAALQVQGRNFTLTQIARTHFQ